MTTDRNIKTSMTNFAQREGKLPLPIMELGNVSEKFRQLAWRYVDGEIGTISHPSYDFYAVETNEGIRHIIWCFKFDVMGVPHDLIEYAIPSKDKKFSRNILLHEEYHLAITFVEYILRHECCSDSLRKSLIQAFEESSMAYFVIDIDGVPTVMPRISRESSDAIQHSAEILHDSNMDGASSHLLQAGEHIKGGRYADSVAHSIRAVESVVRKIDPGANNDLRPALRSLENAGLLKHPALREAFVKLYAYTSDEEGIRHAQVFKEAAEVSLDEALFFIGACASFAAYLTQKHRQAGGA